MNNNLYPIKFNDKLYYEKDCDGTFVAFYTNRYALRIDGFVYIGDGMSVNPEGKWINEE